MLWLKCIPIVLPMVLAHWGAHTDTKKKSRFKRWGPVAIGWFSVAVACWLLSRESADADKWQTEAGKWQAQAGTQLNRIEGRLGDGDATQRYLAGLRELTKRLAEEKTGTATEKFFASAQERKQLRNDIQNANDRIAASERIRVTPAVEFIMQKLDAWFSQAKGRGIVFTAEIKEVPSVALGFAAVGNARHYTFSNGSVVRIYVSSMAIRDGIIAEPLRCMISSVDSKGGGSSLWRFECGEANYSVVNDRTARFGFKDYDGHNENPLQDQKFIDVLNSSLDEVIGFVLDEVASQQ